LSATCQGHPCAVCRGIAPGLSLHVQLTGQWLL
jgi:hypothetical protein